MPKPSQKEAYAVVFVTFLICAPTLIVCAVLSVLLGQWILWAWFVGATAFAARNFYVISPLASVWCIALFAAVAFFAFWPAISSG